MGLSFIVNSILLGVALAMDAFSVSLANGFAEPKMGRGRISLIAGTYALFQFIMPMMGWICVHTAVSVFSTLEKFIPYIALILLGIIGGKMIYEGVHEDPKGESEYSLKTQRLILQGIATSIDALSVGFAIASYLWYSALAASLIIAVVTFVICVAGLIAGKKIGTAISGRAVIAGGVLLILIGIEIFIRGML